MRPRIGVPIPSPLDSRKSLAVLSRIHPRAVRGMSTQTSMIVAGVIVGIIVLTLTIILIRTLRARHPDPKYIPTPFLKKLWTKWKPSSVRYHQPGGQAGTRQRNRPSARDATHADFDANLATEQVRTPGDAAAPDRNTSVRSVMTLPAYRYKPSEQEQVLGREGERDGIDVVVEMPTAEDEEAMREEEMAALYQIRLARRRQIAERDERRRLRAEARARNDSDALREIREQTRVLYAAETEEITGLRESHERAKETRQRAVSSVSYADVGVARLDGTRVRANSTESGERIGLLSDAASIAAVSTRSPTSLSHGRPSQDGRARSSSVLSVDTYHSRPNSPGIPAAGRQSRASSRSGTPRRLSGSMTRAGSSPELIDAAEADLGDGDMPPHSPPGYDEVSLIDEPTGSIYSATPSGRNSPYPEPPPGYPGPTQARNQRLSAHVADLLVTEGAAGGAAGEDGSTHARSSSRDVGGAPQLPSLMLNQLPQIVIEPSSARLSDNGRRLHEQF